ncbi:unnamed protein product [Effrenium voratum]|uniref:Uncharacterized protein n=1 Tax=Effrenium voratum TaxID=2562239 RepID=A0AA36JNU3_9DINO|nr:unnamed protein product [Effrenium voratum]CAJ1409001.1 unnamed protein product [Effrenium voratum]CAJ1450693.1 unnamed protein product [Effrenium voratum]
MAWLRVCFLALVGVVKSVDLACTDAEPQSPRDVTPGYTGDLATRYEPYGEEERRNFLQANLHFHLGAEHKNVGEYDQAPPSGDLASTVAPGLFCNPDALSPAEKAPYNFQHCKNVSVGLTYEFHWVFSSGAPGQLADDGSEGELGIADGLGGAFARTVNADVVVRGQVCLIYNNASLDTAAKIEADYADFLTKWRSPSAGQAVKYVGSTTGSSYNDNVCSPAEVNWHVDLKCCKLSAQAFDRTCQAMYDEGLREDLKPKGSRPPVDRRWVADVTFPLQPVCEIPFREGNTN